MALTPVTDLVASQLGTDKVTNGNFSASGTWTYGQASGGWAYDSTNDEADCDGDQTEAVDLEQDVSAVAAEKYLVQYTISNWEAGEVTPQVGGVEGRARGADGAGEDYITATGTGSLKFQADADFIGTIDDVSVRKVFFSSEYTVRLIWTNAGEYDDIDVQYDKGAGWVTKETIDGGETSYDFENIVPNILYNFRLRLFALDNPVGERRASSNTDSSGCWASTPTATVNVIPNIIESVVGTNYTDTLTATVELSGAVLDATTLKTTYAYYVGDSNGNIYQYSADYLSDAGSNISARWESKDTDFADQNMEWADKFKTIEKVRLHYIDKTSDATVSLLISTDGGASWVSKTRSIGTGDGKGKTADFFLIKTGQIFRFAIENASASDDFQFVGLEIFYSVGGDYFEI